MNHPTSEHEANVSQQPETDPGISNEKSESPLSVSNESADSSETGWLADAGNSFKGFCMGVCDAVPGVSGGTVALIMGIYDRLFIAICHIDRRLFSYLRKREWKTAAHHLDARFLLTLVLGLGLGYVIMSFVIKYVMAHDTWRALTLASFAGMVLGSSVIVIKKIRPRESKKITCWIFGLVGCMISILIAVQNTAAATGEVSLIYVFVCTVIAICAMILPGISGAMLLLIFGVYYYVLEIPRNLIHLENVGVNLLRLGVVLAGCLSGLLTFGRLIKWLLHTYRAPTLSTMLGLMVGSLLVLWPFQHRIEAVIDHHKPTYESFVPAEFSLLILGVVGCVLFFGAAVVVTDRVAMGIAEKRLAEIQNRSTDTTA